MSEKTPYQIMRERQEAVIKKQKQDADNRVEAYKLSIQFNTQEELNEKLEAKKKEIRIAEIEAEETTKRIAENKKRIQWQSEISRHLNQCSDGYSMHSNYSSSSSSNHSSSGSSSDCGSSSSSDSSSCSSSSCD